MKNMLLNDLKKIAVKNNISIGKTSADWMIERGYIKTEIYGWEKPEYLEQFGLSPDATAVPGRLVDEYEWVEEKKKQKDAFGNATGEIEIKKVKKFTGRKILVPTQNYLDFRKFKKQMYKDWYLKKNNILPPELTDEY